MFLIVFLLYSSFLFVCVVLRIPVCSDNTFTFHYSPFSTSVLWFLNTYFLSVIFVVAFFHCVLLLCYPLFVDKRCLVFISWIFRGFVFWFCCSIWRFLYSCVWRPTLFLWWVFVRGLVCNAVGCCWRVTVTCQ
jgi:hypothetical protein